jgi:tricorn protease
MAAGVVATATRLTTHPGEESHPSFSLDGRTLAFLAQYEGPTEVYMMPVSGGRPERRTFEAGRIAFMGWTPNVKILYTTDAGPDAFNVD